MRLLVTGADRVDAGKTTFSTGLVEHADATGFKPRAGNDHWHDHEDVARVTERGALHGKDAARLADASGVADPLDLNPIHRLWRPSPGAGAGMLGREDRSFLLDRVGDEFIVNDAVDVPEALRERLPLAGATRVASLEELNAVMRERHVPALASLNERIDARPRAVVESYGDVARPLQGADPDAVAVVEPRRVRIHDGDRYLNACEVAGGGPRTGQLEQRVGSVVELLDPERTLALPPLRDDERTDPATVAEAYEPAYDALVATALDG